MFVLQVLCGLTAWKVPRGKNSEQKSCRPVEFLVTWIRNTRSKHAMVHIEVESTPEQEAIRCFLLTSLQGTACDAALAEPPRS